MGKTSPPKNGNPKCEGWKESGSSELICRVILFENLTSESPSDDALQLRPWNIMEMNGSSRRRDVISQACVSQRPSDH